MSFLSISNKTKRDDTRFFNRIWKKLHFGHLAKEEHQNAMMASYSSGLFPYSQHLWNGISARRSRNEMTKFSWVEVESSAIPRMVNLQPMVWKIRFQRQVRVQHYCVD